MRNCSKGKKIVVFFMLVLCVTAMSAGYMVAAQKDEEDTIISGVCIGGIDVSGMTKTEAREAVESYVKELSESAVTLMVGEQVVEVPAMELGFRMEEKDIYEEAAGLCNKGNIVKRYKDKKRMEKEGVYYELEYSFDEEAVRKVIEEKCTAFDLPAVNAGLKRSNGKFEITEGTIGRQLDVEQSIKIAMEFLEKEWNQDNTIVALAVTETQPKGTKEELGKVKDLLATATTSYSTSSKNRCGNVERGASLINGTILYPGEEFSAYQVVNPITVENGYFMAASYSEGQVVESPGGGICQVSTTLYNAVLKAELEVTERFNHSMIVTYVDPAKDSAIAGTYKDLKFVNNTEAPIYIEGITAGKKITFNIYGMETRNSNREVEFVSEILEETEPTLEIKTNETIAFGSISKESPHKGIVSKLWKIIKENGVEISRTEVNSSKYAMTPERYTIGTANASPEALAELDSAIAAQDIEMVKAVVGKYTTVQTDTTVVDSDTAAEGNVAGDLNAQQTIQQPQSTQQPTTPAPTQPSATPTPTQTPVTPTQTPTQPPATPTQAPTQQPATENPTQQPAQ